MNIEMLSEQYFEELWKCSERHPNKFFLSSYGIIKQSRYKMIEVVATPLLSFNYAKSTMEFFTDINNNYNLNSLAGFKKMIEAYDKNSNEPISNRVGQQVHNYYNPNYHHSDYSYEHIQEIENTINNEVINNLFAKFNSKEDQEFIVKNIENLFISSDYEKISQKLYLMNYLKQNGREEEGLKIWKTITIKDGNLLSSIEERMKLMKDFFGEEKSHAEILYYFSKRAKQTTRNNSDGMIVRNALINHYNDDVEKMSDYAVYFPVLKTYLDAKINNKTEGFFVNEQENILMQSIDLEQFKASFSVDWFDIQYERNLEYFSRAYAKKEPRIEKSSISVFKPLKKVSHFLFYIGKKEVKGMESLTLKDVQEAIMDFSKLIKETHGNNGNDYTVEFLEKWFDKNKLEKSLSTKNDIGIKKNKI